MPSNPIDQYLIRPATVAMRFNEADHYQQALKTYGVLKGTPLEPGSPMHSISLGVGTSGTEGTEVRLSYDKYLPARQLIYWQVEETDYEAVSNFLLQPEHRLTLVENVVPDSEPPAPDHFQTRRSVFADAQGNNLGIVINPSIPWVGPRQRRRAVPSPSTGLVASTGSLGVCVAIGIVVALVARKLLS